MTIRHLDPALRGLSLQEHVAELITPAKIFLDDLESYPGLHMKPQECF